MGSLSARLLGVHLVLETRQVNRSELNRVVATVMQDINDVWYITETKDVFDRLKDVPIGILADDRPGRQSRSPPSGSRIADGLRAARRSRLSGATSPRSACSPARTRGVFEADLVDGLFGGMVKQNDEATWTARGRGRAWSCRQEAASERPRSLSTRDAAMPAICIMAAR